MSTVFNASGGIVSLPSMPLNTLNLSIKASLGQNQITRNVGNFYASFNATNGAVQQQFSIASGSNLVLPTGSSGLFVISNGGSLNLNLTKTTATVIDVTGVMWGSGVVTVALAEDHGITIGGTASWILSGITPTAYNGTYTVTATAANTFTYSLASNPGTVTILGTAESSPVVSDYTVYMNQVYVSDDSLSAITIANPGTTTVTGFVAYVPYTFSA